MKRFFLLIAVLAVSLSGCFPSNAASAEEIFSNAIDLNDRPISYYGESIITTYEGDQKSEEFELVEYVHEDGRRKIETRDPSFDHLSVSLNDGYELLVYEKGTDEVLSFDLTELEFDTNRSQKEQLIATLKSMESTHTLDVKGQEDVNGFSTFHLHLSPKERNSMIGEMDIWVDEESWFVVKTTSVVGDDKTTIEYKTLDLSPRFEEETFTLDLPDDVEVVTMGEDLSIEIPTREEAESIVGQPFLQLSDRDLSVTYSRYDAEVSTITASYEQDDLPLVDVSVIALPDDMEPLEDDEFSEPIQIRGSTGLYDEMIEAIIFDEAGVRYTVMAMHPDLSKDELVELTESMALSEE